MLASIHIPTRVAGVDDDHGNRVVIGQSFNCSKVGLPVVVREKIEVAGLDAGESTLSFIHGETWRGEQDVGARSSKSRHDNLNGLAATLGEVDIVRRELAWKVSVQVLCY